MPKKLTTEEFITKATIVHGTKYDYTDVVYTNAKTKVSIICPFHNSFSQNPSTHLSGSGCVLCARERSKKKLSLTTGEFIVKAKDVHGDLYDYSEVIYKNSHQHITIKCNLHKEAFQQVPNNHLDGKGCNLCAIELRAKKKTLTVGDFIIKARSIHGDTYDYSLVNYVNAKTNINILCKSLGHGVFSQMPDTHIQGSGCPRCNKGATDPNKPHEVYISEWITPDNTYFYKVGITSRGVSERLRKQQNLSGYQGNVVMSRLFVKGQQAIDLERVIKKTIKGSFVSKEILPDGYTETFSEKDLNTVYNMIYNA
tara:strand:- start:355 stop:1287 length:933 start_codon:yes stop_codon:yes gene_type:complete